MSRDDESTVKWLEETMPRIIENLGPNVEEARYEQSDTNDNSLLMSTLCYVCVTFKDKASGKKNERLPMILKRPPRDEKIRAMIVSDEQFHNEITFYREYVGPDDHFPRCYYSREQPPVDSVIALENIGERGYRRCPYKYDVPLDYTLAAVRELARFHGKGYAMKERQPERFHEIVRTLENARYSRDKLKGEFSVFIDTVSTRAVDYLRKRGHDAVFCDKAEALLSHAYEEIMLRIIERSAHEPLSTLCHGDFTVDNMLFKTEENGQHCAMLLDFAFLSYATPVIDLSTYICLYCSYEIRQDRLFDILRAYHDALKAYLLEAGVRDVERYSYEAILDDYRSGGLFGFIIASFYTIVIRTSLYMPISEEVSEGMLKYTETVKTGGGDEISKILADMLLQLSDLGCLRHIL